MSSQSFSGAENNSRLGLFSKFNPHYGPYLKKLVQRHSHLAVERQIIEMDDRPYFNNPKATIQSYFKESSSSIPEPDDYVQVKAVTRLHGVHQLKTQRQIERSNSRQCLRKKVLSEIKSVQEMFPIKSP